MEPMEGSAISGISIIIDPGVYIKFEKCMHVGLEAFLPLIGHRRNVCNKLEKSKLICLFSQELRGQCAAGVPIVFPEPLPAGILAAAYPAERVRNRRRAFILYSSGRM